LEHFPTVIKKVLKQIFNIIKEDQRMKCQRYRAILIGICCISLIGLFSCAALDTIFKGSDSTKRQSTSMLNYLYPNNKDHIEKPSIPRLALPLSVGVAFVPGGELGEAEKMNLMKKISQEFRQYDFVKSIELIPSD